MDWTSMLGMIGQLAGSATGAAMGSMDQAQAMALIKSAVDDLGKIDVPKLQNLVLQQQKSTGLANIKDDPTYRNQQNAADSQLNDVINSGGLTLSDKAALNAIRNRTARTESAGRNAIEGQMAARGTLDSGSQLAMELQGNQQSANTLSAADEATAGQAQARAYQAIRDRAALAGQGLDRSYNQQSAAARAQDAINAGNTAIANAANTYNAGIPQKNFDNSIHLAQAKGGPAYALAGAYGAQAQNARDTGAGVGNIIAAGAKAAGSSNGASTYSDGQTSDQHSAGGSSDLHGYDDEPLMSDSTRTPQSQPSIQSSSAPLTDGSENYEVDPATGKIRRKTSNTGQNF